MEMEKERISPMTSFTSTLPSLLSLLSLGDLPSAESSLHSLLPALGDPDSLDDDAEAIDTLAACVRASPERVGLGLASGRVLQAMSGLYHDVAARLAPGSTCGALDDPLHRACSPEACTTAVASASSCRGGGTGVSGGASSASSSAASASSAASSSFTPPSTFTSPASSCSLDNDADSVHEFLGSLSDLVCSLRLAVSAHGSTAVVAQSYVSPLTGTCIRVLWCPRDGLAHLIFGERTADAHGSVEFVETERPLVALGAWTMPWHVDVMVDWCTRFLLGNGSEGDEARPGGHYAEAKGVGENETVVGKDKMNEGDMTLGTDTIPQERPERTPGRCLILGLGGGTLVHALRHTLTIDDDGCRAAPKVVVDAVELDAAVVSTAKLHFGCDDLDVCIHVADAEQFVHASASAAAFAAAHTVACTAAGGANDSLEASHEEEGSLFSPPSRLLCGWDAVFIDLYTAEAMCPFVAEASFFASLVACLNVNEGATPSVAVNCPEHSAKDLAAVARVHFEEVEIWVPPLVATPSSPASSGADGGQAVVTCAHRHPLSCALVS